MKKRPTSSRYGSMLERWRHLRGLTQAALAQRIRETTGVPITQSAMSQVINGQRKVPTYWIEPVTATLGVSERQAKLFRKAARADYGELDIPPVPRKKKAPE